MAAPASSQYDVFLSHSSVDKRRVEELARRLKQVGIEPFLDKWNLIPGQPWQEPLRKGWPTAPPRGDHRVRPVRTLAPRGDAGRLEHRVSGSGGKFPVIPVVLPAAERPPDHDLPMFLKRMTWVEFQEGLDDEPAFHRLVCGIRGIAGPGPGRAIFEANVPIRP